MFITKRLCSIYLQEIKSPLKVQRSIYVDKSMLPNTALFVNDLLDLSNTRSKHIKKESESLSVKSKRSNFDIKKVISRKYCFTNREN